MNSLIYRQERDHQVRQAALRLKYNYYPSLDDDLWDWHSASPRSRGNFLRTVIAQRDYNYNTSVTLSPTVNRKAKKITKGDKKQSSNSLNRPETAGNSPSSKQHTKRVTKRSNTTSETALSKTSPNISLSNLSVQSESQPQLPITQQEEIEKST